MNINTHNSQPAEPQTAGFCRTCNTTHQLGRGNTVEFAYDLMRKLEQHKTIDLFSTGSASDLKRRDFCDTSYLFGPARGKMFGLLECIKADGSHSILYSFSGQYNSLWHVEGWVPPLFDTAIFNNLTMEIEKEIKTISGELASISPHSTKWLSLRKKRRTLSQNLMTDIHKLYRLTNFNGHTASLADTFLGQGGIPAGTGDCCAPKLLGFAAQNNLRPSGICEFFWGRQTKSESCQHAYFSTPCLEKCQPILGFMLCGLDTLPR